ncbi:exonuclease domain-containing protein [Ancylobacter amanitiformis]|uniref:Exodeoxyribonuclease X n=1 Tax=Ancylobacter amanitiformis TaxID=217069 RepID=A0ABU0LQF5_9HYPH|nr:exonuclease domain-containing protein [Ancylobacter amanitiformis]MDQ0510938.1 exodeoxyribonuclease X [Ancylobacter amanitiformis]
MIIRCIDFETTGEPTEDVRQAICEVGWCDITVDEQDLEDGFAVPVLGQPKGYLVNPGRPIPPEARAVHHISDRDVVGAPTPDRACMDLASGDIAHYAAHKAEFEQQFFGSTVSWICTYKVALRMWPDLDSHKLQFLRYALDLDIDQALGLPAHRAVPDAYVGGALMARILEEGRVSIHDMVRWSKGPALLPKCTFGEHKGKRWDDVPTKYLVWIVEKSSFKGDVLANAKHHLKNRDAFR